MSNDDVTAQVTSTPQAIASVIAILIKEEPVILNVVSELATMANRYKSVVVVEDGIKHGGIASTLSEMFREEGISVPIHSIGVPLTFLEHSKRAEILQDLGITAQQISRELVAWNSGQLFSSSGREEEWQNQSQVKDPNK